MAKRENLRNVAIIAHVDHGKTTLVDQLLRQSGVFRANEAVAERVMDSGDLERERGITILSKNTAVKYGDIKINIVDTPGHADFGGEVERVLQMVDGVLLLVDAFEGCMPQTRFVLKKALALGKKPLVVLNKIDRPVPAPPRWWTRCWICSSSWAPTTTSWSSPCATPPPGTATATLDPNAPGTDMTPLFEMIVNEVPCPQGDMEGPTQVLFSNIDYDDYVGRIGIGRVERGSIQVGQTVTICGGAEDTRQNARITKLYQFEGLKRGGARFRPAGGHHRRVGHRGAEHRPDRLRHRLRGAFALCEDRRAHRVHEFHGEQLPLCRAGRASTSPPGTCGTACLKRWRPTWPCGWRETDSSDTYKVSGRGELHLSILIEQMRRQGYEFSGEPPHGHLQKGQGRQGAGAHGAADD